VALDTYDFEVVNAFLAGRTRAEIAAEKGVTIGAIATVLHKPEVVVEIERRFREIGSRVATFKINAVNGAANALDMLINLSQTAGTQELQRLASLDVVKISGLMPRKRVLVEANQMNGIDEDTREFMLQVMKELRQKEKKVIEGDEHSTLLGLVNSSNG